MPVRRYGSASSLNRSGEQLRFSATSDIYSDGGQDSLYQSSPDLLHGTNNHHRRSSSTDSMDGSYHGNHSRQSSDSVENYPTRTLSTQRKTSTSTADPLQFIKLKPSNDLAKKAEAQIKATEAVKTERVKVEREMELDIPDDNWQSNQPSDTTGTDWQSNLSSWKNRRRRQSAATYERVEGSVDEAESKKKDQDDKKKTKTYSQIMAERDKRKSTGTLHFYPIDDDDEPSWLTSAKSSNKTKPKPEPEIETEPVIMRRSARTDHSAPPLSSWRSKSTGSLKQRSSSVGSDKVTNYDDNAVAPWAEEGSDEESDRNKKKTDESETNNTDSNIKRTTDTDKHRAEDRKIKNRISDKNGKYSSWTSRMDNSSSDRTSSVYKNDKIDSAKTTNKVSGLLKSFEKKEEDSKVSYEKPSRSFQFSATSDSSRRSEGFRNQKSKSFDTGTAGLTFSASPAKTEKVKSPVNTSVKSPVNPALLRKDASPKQEAPPSKNYIEKTIKISQKPRNARGFGFSITGGADKKLPIEVTKVNLGSAADVCELQVHDEIVSINRKDAKQLTYFQVNRLIEKGVETGELELQIQRKISEEDFWDEDEEDDDDAFQGNSSNRFNSSADRSYSPLQSKHRSFSPVQLHHRSKSPLNSPNRSASPLQSQNRSFSPIQSHNQSTPVERPRRDFSSPIHRKDDETVSPKLDTPSPVQVDEGRVRRQSPLTFDTNITPSERYNKFDRDSESDKSKTDPQSDDDKMWIMDKLVNSSRSVDNSYEPTYNQRETVNTDEKIELAKPQIEVAFSQQVAPPVRQEVIKDTEIIQKSVQSNQYSQPKADTSELPEVSQKVDIEVVERPTVVMRRKKPEPPKPQDDELLNWQAPPREKPPPPADDSSGFGPPAALLRWQRPRPRSEYNFSSKSVLDSSDDFKKRLSGTWHLDKPSTEPESSKLDVQFSSEQQQFESKSKQLQQQYDDEIKKVDSEQRDQNSGQFDGEVITSTNSQELNMEQPIRFQVSSQQENELRIDPRNQYPSEQNLPQYNFHLSLGQSGNSDDLQREELEKERQRIREEEKRHLEEEKRRWEEEERKRFQEKEQQLKEQEEKLRQEKERLRQQQEEMERQKNELERTRIETNSPRFEQSVNRDYSRSTFNSRPQFSTSANMDTKVGPRRLDTAWPPDDKETRAEKERQKLTREDLLAMNRKATPLQRKPETEVVENNSDTTVNKEVPVRHHDLHSLNVVPKSRIRNSVDWISSNDKQYDNTSVHRSNSPHEHWLVEEAERRRLADSKGRPARHSAHVPLSNYSGPIKPVSEGLSNRWRDDSNVPRQQTFDTSSVGLSKPRSLYNSSQHESQQFSAKQNKSMSQTLPPNFSFDSSLGRKEAPPPVAPKPLRSSPNPHSPSSPTSPANHAEQVTAVSGRQGCSHCTQELGFGAAMVIESLGLYYHVQCFRCCVCRQPLGNGSQGADVRVRVNKLHCRNCYSNDEEGLKYSKV